MANHKKQPSYHAEDIPIVELNDDIQISHINNSQFKLQK